MQEADASSQATDTARAKDVVARCGALASERPRASYATKNLEQDLARLLRSGNVEQHRDVLERPLAASALSGRCCSSYKRQQFTCTACSCHVIAQRHVENLHAAAFDQC